METRHRNGSGRIPHPTIAKIARLVAETAMTAPQFGKRGVAPKALTSEERYRQMLGLPLGRRLDPAEIHQAYKHAAKNMHPDHGGDAHAFHELAEARDALMKQR